MSVPRQRVTRSKSQQPIPDTGSQVSLAPEVQSSSTSAGPPVQVPSKMETTHPSNPFAVDFVIPFDISTKGDRSKVGEVREGYEALLRALEGEGGLKVGSRPAWDSGSKGKDTKKEQNAKKEKKEEVWVFVGISDEKVEELVERESALDKAHNLPPRPTTHPTTPATKLRLLYALLTAPPIQHGLGITPGIGQWARVKSIMALHDDQADKEWVKRWSGGDWKIGLLTGLSGQISQDQPPPVHLYFDFLSTYSRSLVPLSLISLLTFFLTPKDSYPPIYAFILSLYATIFVAYWRIRERKFAIQWGTRGCESVAVGRLRTEYVANLKLNGGDRIDAVQAGDEGKRDVKVAASVPVIIACGLGLGGLLMGIFILEAFVGEVYDGFGKEVVPLIPTALFALVVPQIVGAYQLLAKKLVRWEDHPTPIGAEKSLTAKTFAVNGIVAYLGLFLTAFIYVPFGSFIMRYVQSTLATYQGQKGTAHLAKAANDVKLGPSSTAATQHSIKAGRLKGQLFAYTVTNQVINMFLELGLPFVLRFIKDWRAGKTTVKEAVEKVKNVKNGLSNEKEFAPVGSSEEAEERFLEKVERELGLPEYNLFTDYAEMVTQFGYVTIWSIVWPLAPIFALINNYVELRADAVKICKHVRRPIGERVETIGSWLETLSIISWIGAMTNVSLIYLFRPTFNTITNNAQNQPNATSHLSTIINSYTTHSTLRTVLPTLIPLALVALAASHGFLILRWVVEGLIERLVWRGSKEEIEVQKLRAETHGHGLGSRSGLGEGKSRNENRGGGEGLRGGFWNGGEEGAREIGRVTKLE